MLRKLRNPLRAIHKLIRRPVVVLATSPETAHPVVAVVEDSELSVVPEDSVDPRSAT
jgi:hypothetical protein